MSGHTRQNEPVNEPSRPTILKSDVNLFSYWLLAGLRIILTLMPQYGYIHPDEFFQSVEVVTGDIFDVETSRPWEFNATFPIRSIAFPYMTVGLPLAFLKTLAPLMNLWFEINIVSPYVLLVVPRLVSCLLSFACDYSLYKICYAYGQSYRSRLLMFASSYVILVYATRTFSNTTEMVLMSILLFFVADCMKRTDQVLYQDEYLFHKYQAADNPVERVKIFKLRNALPNHSLSRCLSIASLTVAGIFNRPTFIAFAFPPVFFWLQRGLGSKTVGMGHFHVRIAAFILSGIPMALLFILIDSFYYGYLTIHEIMILKINLNNFVVAPLNFFKYNFNTANLAKHGLHPRFLHFAVNLSLLYNVLAIVGMYAFVQIVYRSIKGKFSELPRLQSIGGLMTTSFIIPVAALSIFPHQEPRFLIPVTLPLIFLHAQKIKHVTVLADQPKPNSKPICKNKGQFNYLLLTWYVVNMLLTLFYGFLHQGGVYPLTEYLSNEIQSKPRFTAIHIVTCSTYSLPISLLQLKNTKRPRINKRTGQRYMLAKEFFSYEMGSARLDEVQLQMESLLIMCEKKMQAIKMSYRLYLAIPTSLTDSFMDLVSNSSYSYAITKNFYPHISTEALPQLMFHSVCSEENSGASCGSRSILGSYLNYVSNLTRQIGLTVIQVQMKTTKKKPVFRAVK